MSYKSPFEIGYSSFVGLIIFSTFVLKGVVDNALNSVKRSDLDYTFVLHFTS